jgi:fatty-acyl-CoA synthase
MRVVDLFAQSSSTITFPDSSTCGAHEIVRSGMQLASRFRDGGYQPGDRIAICLPNSRLYLEVIVACSVARLVLVSVNTRYSDHETADLVTRSGAKLFVNSAEALPCPVADRQTVTLDSAHADDPFLVFTTSGTTSKPKMVLHHQRSIAVHGSHAANVFGYTEEDTALLLMPFCGTFGMSSLTAALAGNTTIVVADHFDAASTGATIAQHHVTVVNGSDDMFHRLVEAGADLSSIRLGGYARFNTSLDGIVQRAEKAGAHISGLYGMSEVQALFSLRDPSGDANDRARAGGTLAAEQGEYRIVDGELQLRGPSMFAGYLAEGGAEIDQALTAKNFDDDWFKTGDAAEAETDRTFTYHTRIGDVLRLGGFLVAPADIEPVLLELSAIREAQVVTVDLPTGTRPVAFVVADETFDEQAAIEHCRQRMARYKVPVRVIPLDAFPVTSSANGNKIQVVKLRELAASTLQSEPPTTTAGTTTPAPAPANPSAAPTPSESSRP